MSSNFFLFFLFSILIAAVLEQSENKQMNINYHILSSNRHFRSAYNWQCCAFFLRFRQTHRNVLTILDSNFNIFTIRFVLSFDCSRKIFRPHRIVTQMSIYVYLRRLWFLFSEYYLRLRTYEKSSLDNVRWSERAYDNVSSQWPTAYWLAIQMTMNNKRMKFRENVNLEKFGF